MRVGRLLEPGATFAGYRIEEIRGGGGYGAVYVASETQPGGSRRIALKVIDLWVSVDLAVGRQRFYREVRPLGDGHHPHILPIYAAGEQDGFLYLAMPLLDGDLDEAIVSRGPFSPTLAAHIAVQVARALQAAHERGVVHRDVKPANVLIDKMDAAFPHAWLADFGLAWHRGADRLTAAGPGVGTPMYMAPEQRRGDEATPATDIHALGLVLHEMVVGRPGCQAGCGDRLAVTAARRLHAVAERATAPEPEARYPSAQSFDQAVTDALTASSGGRSAGRRRTPTTPASRTAETSGVGFDPAPSLGLPSGPGVERDCDRAWSLGFSRPGHVVAASSTRKPRMIIARRRRRARPVLRLVVTLPIAAVVVSVGAVATAAGGLNGVWASRVDVHPIVSPAASSMDALRPAPRSHPTVDAPTPARTPSSPAARAFRSPAASPSATAVPASRSTGSAPGTIARQSRTAPQRPTAPQFPTAPQASEPAVSPPHASSTPLLAPTPSAATQTTRRWIVCAVDATLRSVPGRNTSESKSTTLHHRDEFDPDGQTYNNGIWMHGYAPSAGTSGWILTQYVKPVCS
ncbi:MULTISPECIES: protein kinase domain-containing protein [Frankia]|nr:MULTISPECIES: protein kinase [Frankia]